MKPELLATNVQYFNKVLNWKNIDYTMVGDLFRIKGFDEYNKLIDINSAFSTYPFGEIVDRNKTTHQPLKFKVLRDWKKPTSCLTFDEIIERRVKEIVGYGKKINICWSGGIDSTTLLVGFLQHAPHDQLRVIYTPYSVYENRAFHELLENKFSNVELLDISGDVYIQHKFDGIFVNGHGGDEHVASLDKSFYEQLGPKVTSSWKDYFVDKNIDVEFAEKFFAESGKTISSILEARWYFYTRCKAQVFPVNDNFFLNNQLDNRVENTMGFFDCDEFESFMYFHPELLLENPNDYKSHKQFMKNYIYRFDGNPEYLNDKEKTNSLQFVIYTRKKLVMLDFRYVALLSDSTTVRTPNLPFFSKKEFENIYGNSLDYLFNEPNHV